MRYLPLIVTVALIPLNGWFLVSDPGRYWFNGIALGFALGIATSQAIMLAMRRV